MTADFLFRLLLGHLVGDYLLQNEWMALNKSRKDTELPGFVPRTSGPQFMLYVSRALGMHGAGANRFGLRYEDPARTLALLYDRASNAGRTDAPASSKVPGSWR